MAFADTPGAVGTVLNLAAGRRTTTTDSSTDFIAGARQGSTVVGECVALHRGRSSMVWQTSIRSVDGRLCAQVTQTQPVLDAAPV
jgi:1,4-dihydroxy-2-naphthoyl-CoA hydrolase